MQIDLMIPGSGLKTAIYKAWDFTTSEGYIYRWAHNHNNNTNSKQGKLEWGLVSSFII